MPPVQLQKDTSRIVRPKADSSSVLSTEDYEEQLSRALDNPQKNRLAPSLSSLRHAIGAILNTDSDSSLKKQ